MSEPTLEQEQEFIRAGQSALRDAIDEVALDGEPVEMTPEMWEQFVQYFGDELLEQVQTAHEQLLETMGDKVDALKTAVARATVADHLHKAGLPWFLCDFIAWRLLPKWFLPAVELTVLAEVSVVPTTEGSEVVKE